jgi:hypothetical protein
MELLIDEILTLVKKKMVEQGAYDRDAYKNLVEESTDYFVERGKMTDDDNLEFIKDRLMDAYEDVRDSFDIESVDDAADDEDEESEDDAEEDEDDEDEDDIKVLDEEDLEELEELNEAYKKEEEDE